MTKRAKKAWTKWRRLISEQERSGLDVATFCRERALCRPYFFVWKKRLREGAAAKFLEVHVAEPRARVVADDSGIEVRLRNGRSLVVGRGFDAEHVRALLAVVESAG
jgi:hypothetical protein